MSRREQLVGCCDDSSIHDRENSKEYASRPVSQLPAIMRNPPDPDGDRCTNCVGPETLWVVLARSAPGRHTPNVQRAVWLSIALAMVAAPVRADRPAEPDETTGHSGSFWRDVAEPHRDEVESLLGRCRRAIAELDGAEIVDVSPTPAARQALLRDLVNVLRYARKLEPDNLDVLRMLANVADDAGDARQAREALHAIVDLVGEEHAGAEALDRIGVAAIDAGRLDDAIHALRIAQGPAFPDLPVAARVLVHLATALALAGHTADAIETLAGALPASSSFEPDELALVGFALAVQYDRDEQRGAAFEILDRMKMSLGDQLAPALQQALARMRFAPAEDERYYRALMDEVVGDVPEARTEWLLYAADEAAPYRRRALDHVHALDALGPVRKVPLLIAPPPPPQVSP